MTAHLLDGRYVAELLRNQIKQQIEQRLKAGRPRPNLVVVLVGSDPASQIYVENKRKACEQVGINSEVYELPLSTSQSQLLQLITALNQNSEVNGILVQFPLPAHIDAHAILGAIEPLKDVDGFHPYNIGCLAHKQPTLRPCTSYGVMQLLAHYQLKVRGLAATVVGASNIVGRPMALELLNAGATVTIAHRHTQDLAYHVKHADLLVVAIGQPGVIQSSWIKPGAIVVDVGINRLENNHIVGDIEFVSAKERARWISPVPGGVGPMTVSMLLANTYSATVNQQEA